MVQILKSDEFDLFSMSPLLPELSASHGSSLISSLCTKQKAYQMNDSLIEGPHL